MMSEPVEVQVSTTDGARLPVQATPGAAGFDLCAQVDTPIRLYAGERVKVPTGLRVAIPAGYEGQVRPRSGLAINHGITVVNAPGTIDSDYRGEVAVLLVNLGKVDFMIFDGDRIAQLVVAPVPAVRLVQVARAEDLGTTARGEGGFGSTGGGAVPLGAPPADAAPGQIGIFAAIDRGPMEV